MFIGIGGLTSGGYLINHLFIYLVVGLIIVSLSATPNFSGCNALVIWVIILVTR